MSYRLHLQPSVSLGKEESIVKQRKSNCALTMQMTNETDLRIKGKTIKRKHIVNKINSAKLG
jgi:hypothetical protein